MSVSPQCRRQSVDLSLCAAVWLLLISAPVTTATSAHGPLPAHTFSEPVLAYNSSVSMPAEAIIGSLTFPSSEFARCSCRQQCLADVQCRGYGINDVTSSCQLSRQLPTAERLQPAEDVWIWYTRAGSRQLGEPCTSNEHCIVAASICHGNTCVCPQHWEPTAEGQCRKTGSFLAVGTGRLTGASLWEAPAATAAECEPSCADNATCLAFDFSADQQSCAYFEYGITTDTGSGRNVQSFIWQFPAADGTPPADYELVDGLYIGLRPAANLRDGAFACYPDGARLYAPVSQSSLDAMLGAALMSSAPDKLIAGLDNMLDANKFITSDAMRIEFSALPWGGTEGTNSVERCVFITRSNSYIGDVGCLEPYATTALCQYIGENLATHCTAWMTKQYATMHASLALDSLVSTFAHTDNMEGVKDAWFVDLGRHIQITAVMLATRDCCSGRTNNTEIRTSLQYDAWEAHNSVLCTQVHPDATVPDGYTRLFHCDTPVTGRYLRVRRNAGGVIDFTELAVFGNKIH